MRLRDSPARKVRILFQAACASEWCSSLFLHERNKPFQALKSYGKHNFATLARTDTFSSSRFTREWSMHICLPCANIASKITLLFGMQYHSLSAKIFSFRYMLPIPLRCRVSSERTQTILSFGIVHRQWLTANSIN